MDNEKTFKFKYIDTFSGSNKDGKRYYKLICYCNFGFIVNFFITPEKMDKLTKLMNEKDFDINSIINVFYDNNKQQLAYIIKL